MLTKISTFILLSLSFSGLAQDFILSQQPEVINNNESLRYPWVGGLNSVNANMIDLDLDGLEDMIVYEKSTREVFTFTANNPGNFSFSPEYAELLPEINGWIITKDYNGDGKKDIFTSDPLGIRLYINNLPQGFHQYPVAPLLSKGVAGNINIYLSDKDMPAIEDIDNDGDLDILNLQFAGTSIEFHKNLQVEEGLSPDTIVFQQETGHWGDIRICGCNLVLNYTEECPENSRTEHSSGHSLLLLDLDGDNIFDLSYSDSNCRGLYFLTNTGTNENALLQKMTSVLPENVNMNYPSPVYDDFDHDGKKDLLVSPGSSGSFNYSMDFARSVWLFKNQGATGNPDFTLQEYDFLQDNMIDVGLNAYPEFYDYDNDGDPDMFLGKLVDYQNNFMTGLTYYRNTGSYGNPVFELVTEDAFGLMVTEHYNMKPKFVDVTGDRKPELVIMATTLFTGVTSLFYFENSGLVNFNSDYMRKEIIETLPFGSNYEISDINDDGVTDILITSSTGIKRYELRNGKVTLIDNKYLDLPASISDMVIDDVNGDGMDDFLYAQSGFVYAIYDFKNNTEATPLNLKYTEDGSARYSGQLLKLTTAKLLGNNTPELMTATITGGLKIFTSEDAISVPENDPFVVFPNPQDRRDNLNFQSNRNMLIFVYSTDGKIIISEEYVPANDIFQIQLRNFAPGMYIIRGVINESDFFQRKFVVVD